MTDVFDSSFPQLKQSEYSQIFQGISYRWIALMNFNRDAMLYYGVFVPQDFWNSNSFLCNMMLSAWVPEISEIEYVEAKDLASLLPCMAPNFVRELRRRQRKRIGARMFSNKMQPLLDVYKSTPNAAPMNRITSQVLIDSFIEFSVFEKNEKFFKSVSMLLPFMSIKVFEYSLYHTRREKGIARLISNYSKNFALIENLEFELRRSVSTGLPIRHREHTFASTMPNLWSGQELCESFENIAVQESSEELATVVKDIAQFNDNLELGKKMQVLYCYLKLTNRASVNLATASEVQSLIKGAKLEQLPTLRISDSKDHVEFLRENEHNFTPLQRYHFLEQEDSSKLPAEALLSLGEKYLSDFGIFRLNKPSLLADIGFRYLPDEGLVNINPVDHKTITGEDEFKLLLLDSIGDDFKLSPEIARRHNFAASFAPSHMSRIADSDFFDVIELLVKKTLSEQVLIEIAVKTKTWKEFYRKPSFANFSLIDLTYSEIEALGGYVLKHFKMTEFLDLKMESVKCRTIFGLIGESINLDNQPDFVINSKFESLVSFYVDNCSGASKSLHRKHEPQINSRDMAILGSLNCFLNEKIKLVDDEVLKDNFYRFSDCLFTREQGIHMHNKLSSMLGKGKIAIGIPEILTILGPNTCLVFTSNEIEAIFANFKVQKFDTKSIEFFEAIVKVSSLQNPKILPESSDEVQLCATILMEKSMEVLADNVKAVYSDFERSDSAVVSCARLKHIRDGISFISPELFEELSIYELERCLEYLTHHKHITRAQLMKVLALFNEKLRENFEFNDKKKQHFEVRKLGKLYPLLDLSIDEQCENPDLIAVLGKLPNLSLEQLNRLFKCSLPVITDPQNGFLTIKGIKIAGNLICGATVQDLSRVLTKNVAKATLSDLGRNLKSCAREQLQEVFMKVEDSVPKWENAMIFSAKAIMAGVPSRKTSEISKSQFEFFQPEIFSKMSYDQLHKIVSSPSMLSSLGHRQLLELNRIYFEDRRISERIEAKLFREDQIVKNHVLAKTVQPKVKGYLVQLSNSSNGNAIDAGQASQTESSNREIVENTHAQSSFVYVIINLSPKIYLSKLFVIVFICSIKYLI